MGGVGEKSQRTVVSLLSTLALVRVTVSVLLFHTKITKCSVVRSLLYQTRKPGSGREPLENPLHQCVIGNTTRIYDTPVGEVNKIRNL